MLCARKLLEAKILVILTPDKIDQKKSHLLRDERKVTFEIRISYANFEAEFLVCVVSS